MSGPSNGFGCGVFGSNILHLPMNLIPDKAALVKKIRLIPDEPRGHMNMPLTNRYYELRLLKKIRIPSPAMLQVAREVDVMMHEGYMQRDPFNPSVWSNLFSDVSSPLAAEPALVTFVTGISGTGKTKCIQRILESYEQRYFHAEFPGCVGGLTQLCWLYVQMPPSGKLKDLIKALIDATAFAFKDPELVNFLRPNSNDLAGTFSNWTRFIQGHWLGVLVIDEIQNLFKLPTVKTRQSKRERESRELRLSDDETLKT